MRSARAKFRNPSSGTPEGARWKPPLRAGRPTYIRGIGEASLTNKVEAGIFARVIQDIEDACLDKSRRVLRSGWTARSWQQDGLA